ncbi:MAG: type I secretion C-terminal target domain-containing protein, partial [Betaproteobacteria bacterium]|nr:type I secretion C-terminal target domain-containing protein [Betaproteobacteria bacterium]
PVSPIADATNIITVGTAWEDPAGNAPAASTNSANYTVDTIRPTVLIGIDDTALKIGDVATVTFTFSEVPSNFSAADVTYDTTSATLGAITATGDPKVFTATLTPVSPIADATNIITVGTAWEDPAGNAPAASTNSANYTVDTISPTATITGTSNATGGTATFNVTFTEAVTGVSSGDFSFFGTADPTKFTSIVVGGSGTAWTLTVNYPNTGPNSQKNKTLGLNLNGGTDVTDSAGNVASATTYSTPQFAGNTPPITKLNPAGIVGEEINLALTDPSANHVGQVTLNISGVPTGWSFNAGTNNGDGTWTVQTNDPGALTITTAVNFTGAIVLPVTMNWTNADGTTGSTVVYNNVEAYAPGSPIFAVSADDHLTGSSGADLFVFAQPIANDTIHNFDAASDKIDLIAFSGVTSFADLAIANDANGNAVITLASGATITVLGVDAATLTASNFMFDVEPVTTNAGTMTISDGALLPLGGTIDNSGTIALGSTGSETDLEILVRGATLQGGGQVTLSDSSQNYIFGGAAESVLTNLDNTISGAGQLGAGQMTLVNAGMILANGSNALVIDTGTNVVTNSGTLEATGSGGLVVDSALANTGSLWANGGNIILHGDVTGAGSATISGAATLEFGAASDANVAFDAGAAGILKLDVSAAFTGTVSGFVAGDSLELGDIVYGSGVMVSYTANDAATGGTLIVSDGTHTSQITIAGQYEAAGMQSDGQGGTHVAYDAAAADHSMQGGIGNDILVGGGGNDAFAGGQGSDAMTGGAGSDTFKFLASDGASADTITDFTVAASGGDVLDVSDLLVGSGATADTIADFVSVTESGGNTVVSVDADGAGAAPAQQIVTLQGVTNMTLQQLLDNHQIVT